MLTVMEPDPWSVFPVRIRIKESHFRTDRHVSGSGSRWPFKANKKLRYWVHMNENDRFVPNPTLVWPYCLEFSTVIAYFCIFLNRKQIFWVHFGFFLPGPQFPSFQNEVVSDFVDIPTWQAVLWIQNRLCSDPDPSFYAHSDWIFVIF